MKRSIQIVIITLLCFYRVHVNGAIRLSPDEDQKPDIPTLGLVAYYPFNGNANDESGKGNNGTIIGGATVSGILVLGDNDTDGISLPNNVLDGLEDFSISAWLKINTIHKTGPYYPGNSWITGSRSGEYNAFGLFYEYYKNAWKLVINDVRNDHFESDTTMNDRNWHHVVISRNGFTARLYIDGKEIGNGIQVANSLLDVDENGIILGQEQDKVGGNFETFQSWAGEMDNLRIYNHALTEEEIQALYHEGGWGDQ
jgi:MSHA biogenesis protein MshQ